MWKTVKVNLKNGEKLNLKILIARGAQINPNDVLEAAESYLENMGRSSSDICSIEFRK